MFGDILVSVYKDWKTICRLLMASQIVLKVILLHSMIALIFCIESLWMKVLIDVHILVLLNK